MAVVLTSEESTYFSPSTLRRSHSQSQFGSASSTPFQRPSRTLKEDEYDHFSEPYSRSAPSSTSSSPRIPHAESTDLSSASTPASNFSLISDYDDTLAFDDGEVADGFGVGVPAYKHEGFFLQPQPPTSTPYDNLEPPPSPKTGDSYTPSPEFDSSNDTPRPDIPDVPEHAEDDTAVTTRPSRQVDYLSHDWREEDIWSSWRYIVNRRGEFSNSERLENASWRTWAKAKNNLKTISPETLNWLKECDVTWLYGPLQPGPNNLGPHKLESTSGSLSRTSSLVNLNKKPILKKRSMSEVMLQRSLSNASLLKQATAAVQAQGPRSIIRPSLVRSTTDSTSFPSPTRRMSHGQSSSSVAASDDSSGVTSPSAERKHIHFNEQVEQCIAVEVKGEDEDDVDIDQQLDADSDSSGGVVMKRGRARKSVPSTKKRKKNSPAADGKIIAMLPSTTLKYRTDTPEPPETAMKHSTGRGHLISPSSSQETLRPGRGRFYFEEDDDIADGFCDPNLEWNASPDDDGTGGLHRSSSSSSLTNEPAAGMRRTPSGMLMPYEEGDAAAGEGIFGRVIDTVNTARDIAHVIWNVGWRK